MGPFNHNSAGAPPPPSEMPEAFEIPECRTLKVKELSDDGMTWNEVGYEGHVVQMTDAGGLNILRVVVVEGQARQALVVGKAPGEWKDVREVMDITETSRLAIH